MHTARELTVLKGDGFRGPVTCSASDTPPLIKPVFVVGTVRSGTTLLAACLGEHPNIVYVTYELSPEWCQLGNIAIGSPGAGHTTCPPVTARHATPDVRERVRLGFAGLFAEENRKGEARFLSKNPHLWNKLPFLHAVFPDARLVVISRDLRSTVLSTQMLWIKLQRTFGVHHYLPREPDSCWHCARPEALAGHEPARVFPGGSVGVIAEYWLRTYETIQQTSELFDQVLHVTHRDLTAAPLDTLNRLLRALELAPMPRRKLPVIDPHRNRRWEKLLASREKRELTAFAEAHRDRIQKLSFVDRTL